MPKDLLNFFWFTSVFTSHEMEKEEGKNSQHNIKAFKKQRISFSPNPIIYALFFFPPLSEASSF